MIRVMLDSATPEAIPDSAPMVAGYVNGRYAWPKAAWERFADRPAVRINVTGDPAAGGDALDVETGDATPADAPAWYDARKAAGAKNLAIYCSRDTLPAVNQHMGARRFFRWVATLDGTCHIDGHPPLRGPAAVQILGAAAAGVNADISLVYEDAWHPMPSLQQAIAEIEAGQRDAAAALAALRRYAAAAGS
jgi:hypothetical protein